MTEPLRTLTIATAGHVDHGKSTLIRRLTGTDTDTLAEEKARGMSINLGFAYLPVTDDAGNAASLAFVDVPGHADFTANMLAGVGLLDTCLLVVAADDGVMPQTREHVAILDLLGFRRGCVVLTKTDRVDDQQLAEARVQLDQFLAGTSLSALPVFPVSAETGAGLPDLVDYLALLALELPVNNDLNHHSRFAVDRSFSVAGLGTVVTGMVVSGNLREGESLVHSGSGQTARIKRLRHHRQDVAAAGSGQRVALNIDLPVDSLTRGDWLLAPPIYRPVTLLDVCLRGQGSAGSLQLRPASHYHLHLGTAHHMVTARRLGDSDYYRLRSEVPLFACYGDRLILRDPASVRTLAGGTVTDSTVSLRRRAVAQRLARLQATDQAELPALLALLELLPGGVSLSRFAVTRNLTESGLAALLEALPASTNALPLRLPGQPQQLWLLGRRHYDEMTQRAQQVLTEYHRANPFHAGISQSALPARLQLGEAHHLFPALLQQWFSDGLVSRDGTQIRLTNHSVRTDPAQQDFMRRIGPLMRKGGFTAPRTHELAEALRLTPARVEKHLKTARLAGELIKVADNRHYLPETIAQLAAFTEQLTGQLGRDQGFTVQQFRDASAIGRNLCIEILEYFDSVGYTRRDGNTRYLRSGYQQLFGPASPQE